MKIKLKNTEVTIFIPDKIKKYNDETIKKMYDSGMFDDVDNIHNFKDIWYQDPENYVEKHVKNIGIWVSGGADSSILLYLLSKKIKDENLDVMIHPFSVRRGRPVNPIYAENVIDFIVEKLNFENMNEIKIYYPDKNDEYQREIKEFRERDVENFNSNKIEIMYSGITSNPPENDSTISKNKERSRDESSERLIEDKSSLAYYINPFFKINKKNIAEIYEKFDLLNDLFPITRSCEGDKKDTRNYTTHCGKCWWCEERLWAFGRLK